MRFFCIFCLVVLNGCGSLRPYDLNPENVQQRQHVDDLATKNPGEQSNFVAQAGRFRQALQFSSGDPTDGSKATTYLEAGVTVSDLYCRRFFEVLGEQRADNEAARGAFNIADGVTAAALGLAEASADAVAGVSVGFSAIEALFENLDAAYLVSPEIDQVEALVFASRETLYNSIVAGGGATSYYDAERKLSAYHQLCTFNGVTRLVNEAVANGQPELQPTSSNARNQISLLAAQADIDALSTLITDGAVRIVGDNLVYLYAHYFFAPTGDQEVDLKLRTLLDAFVPGDVTDVDNNLREKSVKARTLLLAIDRHLQIGGSAKKWVNDAKTKALQIRTALTEFNEAKAANCPNESSTDEKEKRLQDAITSLRALLSTEEFAKLSSECGVSALSEDISVLRSLDEKTAIPAENSESLTIRVR